MSEEEAWQAVLDRFVEVVDHLEASIEGLADADLDLSVDEDSWTVRQTIHHVVDGDDIWKVYIKAVLGQPARALSLQWYWDVPQTEWAQTWAYADRPLAPSLNMLRTSRNHIAGLLGQVPGSSERCATFCLPDGEESVLTVRDLVVMQTNHVTHHVEDIRAIRERNHV